MRALAFCLLALMASPAVAGKPKGEAEAIAQVVAPYVDDSTLVVGYLDVQAIDVPAIVEFLKKVGLPAKELQTAQQQAGGVLSMFKKAGGRKVYAVVGFSGTFRPSFALVIPVEPGTDPQAMKALLGKIHDTHVQVRDQLVVACPGEDAERLKQLQPKARPEFAKALASVAGMAQQAAAVPPPALRKALQEMLPRLPAELGGQPTSVLDKGIQWLAYGSTFPPNLQIRVVAQSESAEAAKNLNALWEKVTELAIKEFGRQRLLGPVEQKLLQKVNLKVEGDRLTWNLDGEMLTGIFVPSIAKIRQAAARTQSMNNLKQIGLAQHNYHDTFKHFPPRYSADRKAKPLLSWRVHILPYLDASALYEQFKLDEPWDSPHNKKLLARMPLVYRSPLQKNPQEGKTVYLVPAGKDTIFTGPKGTKIRDILDGTSNTILAVEANDDHAVYWTKPDDFDVTMKDPLAALVRPETKGVNILFADGSVRFLPANIELSTLRALFTKGGGEAVNVP